MSRKTLIVIFVSMLFLVNESFSVGLFPWEFGMNPKEVASFQDVGPYKKFSNGDLETYNGIYNGKKENIQFYFSENHLNRIAVYLYEGKDSNAARAAWVSAYNSLSKQYGEVNIPEVQVGENSDPITPEVLSIAAAANADATGETVMEPKNQPHGIKVSSKIISSNIQGNHVFFVLIALDPNS